VDGDRRPAAGIARRLPVDTLAVPDLEHAPLEGFDLRETFHISRCPRRDSNPRTRLRRPVLYPLSYGGRMCSDA
jgi:hypothetical protein